MLCTYKNLADMNIEINTWLAESFGIKPSIKRSSNMKICSVNEQRVIDICHICGCNLYISGNGARAYQKEQDFSQQGIKLWYTDFQTVEYQQLWNAYIPNLSVIDFICNYGFDWNLVIKKMAMS